MLATVLCGFGSEVFRCCNCSRACLTSSCDDDTEFDAHRNSRSRNAKEGRRRRSLSPCTMAAIREATVRHVSRSMIRVAPWRRSRMEGSTVNSSLRGANCILAMAAMRILVEASAATAVRQHACSVVVRLPPPCA